MLKLKENNINVKNNDPKVVEFKNEDVAPTVYQKQEINQNKLDWFDVNEEGAAAIETIHNDMEELDLDAVDSNLNPEAPSFELDEVQTEEFPLTEYLPQEPIEQIDNAVTDIDKINQSKYFYFYQGKFYNASTLP